MRGVLGSGRRYNGSDPAGRGNAPAPTRLWADPKGPADPSTTRRANGWKATDPVRVPGVHGTSPRTVSWDVAGSGMSETPRRERRQGPGAMPGRCRGRRGDRIPRVWPTPGFPRRPASRVFASWAMPPAPEGGWGRWRACRGPVSWTVIANDRPRSRAEPLPGRRGLRRRGLRYRRAAQARNRGCVIGPPLYAFQCLSTMSLTASEMATSNTSISSTGRRLRSCWARSRTAVGGSGITGSGMSR